MTIDKIVDMIIYLSKSTGRIHKEYHSTKTKTYYHGNIYHDSHILRSLDRPYEMAY